MVGRAQKRAAVLGVLAGAVAAASPAWGCSPNVASITTNVVTVPAGGEVVATVSNFAPPKPDVAESPVEVRWNTLVGAPVASSPAGLTFSVVVAVPADAAPGYYYVTAATTSLTTGKPAQKAAAPLEVFVLARPPVVVEPQAPPVEVESPDVVPEPEPEAPPVVLPVEVPPVGSQPVGPEPLPTGSSGSVPPPPGGVASPQGSGPVPSPPTQVGYAPPQGTTSGGSPVRAPSAVWLETHSPLRAGAVVAPASTRLPGPAAGTPAVTTGQVQVGPGPAPAWSIAAEASVPGPSLFEPVEASDGADRGRLPVGPGAVSLGLLSILAAGVVAGQRRLAAAGGRA